MEEKQFELAQYTQIHLHIFRFMCSFDIFGSYNNFGLIISCLSLTPRNHGPPLYAIKSPRDIHIYTRNDEAPHDAIPYIHKFLQRYNAHSRCYHRLFPTSNAMSPLLNSRAVKNRFRIVVSGEVVCDRSNKHISRIVVEREDMLCSLARK